MRRTEFERRRKLHYKEYFSVPLARRLISEEFSEWTSESSSHMDKREGSLPCSEVCPESDVDFLYDSDDKKLPTSLIDTPTQGQEDVTPHDVEPGFDPSHPCYQKLMAEINLGSPSASMSHLHTIPSGSSHTVLPVPHTTARQTAIITGRKSLEPISGEPKPRVCHANFPDMPNYTAQPKSPMRRFS